MSLNSYELKYIALITMILDHIGAIFFSSSAGIPYYLLRGIGRLSFPIFCFLLVEGFFHTRDRLRYLSRLILFALISEIPFDIAMNNSLEQGYMVEFHSQNVFFTLALAFAAMIVAEYNKGDSTSLLAAVIVFPMLAELIHSDYAAIGVITTLLFYLWKSGSNLSLWMCYLPLLLVSYSSHIQIACILSIFFLSSYNGEKGHGSKYLFYLAYPAHFLFLYIIQSVI